MYFTAQIHSLAHSMEWPCFPVPGGVLASHGSGKHTSGFCHSCLRWKMQSVFGMCLQCGNIVTKSPHGTDPPPPKGQGTSLPRHCHIYTRGDGTSMGGGMSVGVAHHGQWHVIGGGLVHLGGGMSVGWHIMDFSPYLVDLHWGWHPWGGS